MKLQRIGLTALFALLATLTIGDFRFIPNPKSKTPNRVALAQTPDARKAEADRLFQQGNQQFQTSQFEAALQSLQQALTIYREIGDRFGEAKSLASLSEAYEALGNYAKVVEYYQPLLMLAQSVQNRDLEMIVLSRLGLAYTFLGNYTKAVDYYQQSLAIARSLPNREKESAALLLMGSAYFLLGDFTQAIDYFQQGLVLARSLQNREQELIALSSMGRAYYSLEDYNKAIDYYQQSLAIARSLQNRERELLALENLGKVYLNRGDNAKATDYYQQSLVLARSLQNREKESEALRNLGKVYLKQGDNAKAIDYYQQSLVKARQVGKKAEIDALNALGDAYFLLGYYAQAVDYHQQSLAIARKLPNRLSEILVLNSLGNDYYFLGDYAKAVEYLEQSLRVAQKIGNRVAEQGVVTNLALPYLSLKNYDKAIEYAQQSLAFAREVEHPGREQAALSSLGIIYGARGDYPKAIEYLQQSLALARQRKEKSVEAENLVNLGIAYYNLGNLSKAIDYYQQSLAIIQETGDTTSTKGITLGNLGLALADSGNLVQAEEAVRASIDYFESQRRKLGDRDTHKVSFFDKQEINAYPLLLRILIAQNKTNEALEISERGRARAFVELLTKRLSANQTEESTITPPTIEQIKQIASNQNATLVQYAVIYDIFKFQDKREFKESELYMWVIKPTGEVTFRRSDLKPLWQQQNTSLENLVFSSRDSIGVRGFNIVTATPVSRTEQRIDANLTQQLQQLHKLLIEPIADILPNDSNARVVFIPQKSLFLVPFPALLDSSGKYLIEKHTILTAPGIQVLQLTRQQREKVRSSAQKDALVVGNPIMPFVSPELGKPPEQLPPLPGAEREANAIASLLSTKPLIGDRATEAAIVQLLPKARFIHLATHGLFNDIRGLESAIALAPSGNDNGLLTAEEILDLKLNAELVVLSACDTGRGKITGDGVIGLSRSLISAGVPSVLVSLWQVPDAPTASLMTEFYQNIQKNPDKAQALRQAVLTTMKQNPHPKNWAAFTLIGEAE